jgi:hypothetical protein
MIAAEGADVKMYMVFIQKSEKRVELAARERKWIFRHPSLLLCICSQSGSGIPALKSAAGSRFHHVGFH